VKGVRRIDVRLGNWLAPEQGRRLLESATPLTARELRDHAMVAMLIGCGLRRAELLALRLESIQQREEHWVIADLVGKGGHVRTVPIPAWVKSKVDAWTAAAAPRRAPESTSSPRTTCGAPAPVSATSRAANWIRSSFYSATSPSRRRSAISDASRSSGLL
jgi:site-specific recombinase XerD